MAFLEGNLQSELDENNLFAQVDALQGEVFRSVAGRRTFRVNLGGRFYFAKIHYGVGWWEIIKNLLQLRLPVLGADNEWRAIQKLQALNIDTLTAVAFSSEGRNPARRKSLVVTEALDETLSLEELVLGQQLTFRLKRQLISKIALVAKTLHENGVNHRDFYICHFLLPKSALDSNHVERLHLIDLHRVQIRPGGLPSRWREKDLAGLLFSSADAGMTKRDVLRFVRRYCEGDLRQALKEHQVLWQQVVVKAARLYKKDQGKSSAFLEQLAQDL